MTEQNHNKKALTEMKIAQRKMMRAQTQLRGLRENLEASNLAFNEATSTSTNRNCSQYQAIAHQFAQEYKNLTQAVQGLETAFEQPMITKMIAAQQDSDAQY